MRRQPAAKADPAQAQAIVTKVCAACHATDGNSVSPANPVLAGQHADYLAKQLADYKANKDRKNPVMYGMVIATVAAGHEKSRRVFRSAKAETARGAKIQRWSSSASRSTAAASRPKALPACASCHGPNGAGIPAQFPRVAGQYAEYTAAQLQAFGPASARTTRNR